MKTISPISILLRREGVVNRISRLPKPRTDDIAPSLWGRAGVGLLCLFLFGCITEWEAKDMDEIAGILVVEGFITDDESVITLSRSKGLSFEDNILDLSPYRVTDANVSIECDDGTQWLATGQNSGKYTIQTEKLNPERQYRLKIEVDRHEYQSEYACPMVSPEIDSAFWIKRGSGQPVTIHVATHAPDSTVQYYRWSYTEDWEYTSFYYLDEILNRDGSIYQNAFPFYCWDKANNNGLLPGSSEKTVFGKLKEKITEINPWDEKLSILYRIKVRQNVIRKRAYDYFEKVKKNAGQTGSLFAHVPSEIKGNIICTTDPGRVVIGYVDVSTTTQTVLFIYNYEDDVYEPVREAGKCPGVSLNQMFYYQVYGINPEDHVVWQWSMPWPATVPTPTGYIHKKCVDCTLWGGATQKPADWPNDHSDAYTIQE